MDIKELQINMDALKDELKYKEKLISLYNELGKSQNAVSKIQGKILELKESRINKINEDNQTIHIDFTGFNKENEIS